MTSNKKIVQKHGERSFYERIKQFPGDLLETLTFDMFKSKPPALSTVLSEDPNARAAYLGMYAESLNVSLDDFNFTAPLQQCLTDSRRMVSSGPLPLPETTHLEQHFLAVENDLKTLGWAEKMHPDDLHQELTGKMTTALSIIKAQHQADKRHLISTVNHLPYPEQNAAIERLEHEQAEALKTFETALKDNLSSLQKAGEMERHRVATLGNLSELNEKILKAVDIIAKKKPIPQSFKGNTNSTILGDTQLSNTRKRLKYVTLDDLIDYFNGQIPTLTKNIIEMTKDSQGYMIKINRPSTLLYNMGLDSNYPERLRADLIMAAQLLKLSGQDKPTAFISESDPKKAAELAKEAYRALRAVGYDEKDITLNMAGSTISVTDLFKEDPLAKNEAESHARNQERFRDICNREPLDNRTHQYKNLLNQKPDLVVPTPSQPPVRPPTP